jgi:hypothetical protein
MRSKVFIEGQKRKIKGEKRNMGAEKVVFIKKNPKKPNLRLLEKAQQKYINFDFISSLTNKNSNNNNKNR